MYSHNLILKARSWALNGSHLRVFPQLTTNTYTYKGIGENGKPKSKTKSYVNLVIETGNARHVGTQEYKQDTEMTDGINKIYVHYYLKAHPNEND